MRAIRGSGRRGRGLYPTMHWARGCVYPSMHWAGGVSKQALGRGSVCWRGMSAQGVSAQGGVCLGIVCLGELSTLGGVCPGGVCPWRCLPSWLSAWGWVSAPVHAAINPPLDRMTDVCENITLPQLRCGR